MDPIAVPETPFTEPSACNTYFVGAPVGQSLFLVSVPAQSIHAVQPDAGYYTLRTLASVLDEWTGSEFPVSFSPDKGFEL